jgi:hypothetical protein
MIITHSVRASGQVRTRLMERSQPADGLLSILFILFFSDSHGTTQTLITCRYTHLYEYTYANPTPMISSEGLSTGRSGDSRSHHWRLVVDGNVAYHLTYNAGKSWNKYRKRCEHQDLNPGV